METKTEAGNFNPEEGLRTIYAMIQSAKSTIGENYLYYLLWGYLVLITCIAEYALITLFRYDQHYLVWPVLMGLGVFASVLFNLRQKKRSTSKSLIGQVMVYFWGGWLVSFVILIVFANLRESYTVILPLAMVMYGLGIFVSGGVIDFRPLIIGGILSWIAAVVSFFQPHAVQLLIMIGVVIVSYIVPGHLLRRMSINQQV
ncbi:MAG TPA: hypothetical protein VJ203_08295 [Bacteroidales bacterium]|nr:hypothetical protein [Bacteroidales bacterium]